MPIIADKHEGKYMKSQMHTYKCVVQKDNL